METSIDEVGSVEKSLKKTKKSKYLDLESVYKSKVLNNLKESSNKDNVEVRKEKKKRKTVGSKMKEPEGKKSKKSFDEEQGHVNGVSDSGWVLSSSSQNLNKSGNGLIDISFIFGNGLRIPTRPRGSVRRKRVISDFAYKPFVQDRILDQAPNLDDGVKEIESGGELEMCVNGEVKRHKADQGSNLSRCSDSVKKDEGDQGSKLSRSSGGKTSSCDLVGKLNAEVKKGKGDHVSKLSRSSELNGEGKKGKVARGLKLSRSSETETVSKGGVGKLNGEGKKGKGSNVSKFARFSGGEIGSSDTFSKLNCEAKKGNSDHLSKLVRSSGGETSSRDPFGKLNSEGKKRKGPPGDKKGSVKVAQLAKEEDGLSIVNNGGVSSRKRKRNNRKSQESEIVVKKVESLPDGDDDEEENLEENAARMLSSRFNPSWTGFSFKNTSSFLPSKDQFSLRKTVEQNLKSNRSWEKQKRNGLSGKNGHYYEIHPRDLKPHWVLDRRIKVFWPLDKCWYDGLVSGYDSEKKLHHVKYDDRDEEWVNLQTKKFKLLLLPDEVPGKGELKESSMEVIDDVDLGNCLDEPIMSWFTRSHRVKHSSSIPLKKRKISLLESPSTSSEPIVYYRRRFRKKLSSESGHENGCNISPGTLSLSKRLIESEGYNFEICLSLPSLGYLLGSELHCLSQKMILSQYAIIIARSSLVIFEMLFVDNIVGARSFLFEGSLKQAIRVILFILSVFNRYTEDQKFIDLEIPVTSVRFRLSSAGDPLKQYLFTFYSFCKLNNCEWSYLDSKLERHCLLTQKLPLSECTYVNIKALESRDVGSSGLELSKHKDLRRGPTQDVLLMSSPGESFSIKAGKLLRPFAVSFNAAPTFFVGLHLKMFIKSSFACLNLRYVESISGPITQDYSEVKSYSEKVPITPIVSSQPSVSPLFSVKKTNNRNGVFSNGPKRRRTQVQYTMPFEGYDLTTKHRSQKRSSPYKRITRSDDKRISNNSTSSRRNLELSHCDGNVLITHGDRCWRESGAIIVLESADQNESRLAVKFSGVTKYSCKVNSIMQPGSTNRHTHAMMWKGGKDWVLEFPDRNQWVLFKEMHEECCNRNVRAASIKVIPIPGVRSIDESDGFAYNGPFVRHFSKYIRQVESDVEMALNPSRVLYDMDTEDEQWLSKIKQSRGTIVTDELFEKTMDMFEKVAYARQCDHFSSDEIEELVVRVGSTQVAKVIYEHWREKRQQKGMPLMRHLQSPLWEIHMQQVKEWEQAVSKGVSVANEQPPVLAFCLKPRGLEVPNNNKGSKQRSHKKLPVSVHNNHDDVKRLNGNAAFGDEKPSPLFHQQASTRVFSPREECGSGYLSLSNEWSNRTKLHRHKVKKIGATTTTTKTTFKKKKGFQDWSLDVPENEMMMIPIQKEQHNNNNNNNNKQMNELEELRLRDASKAAKQAINIAKLKRERAEKLLYRADVAIHKVVVALMNAEAMEAAATSYNG